MYFCLMMRRMFDHNQQVLLALVRAGLWERDAELLPYGEFDLGAVLHLAGWQSVAGLVAAGLEHVSDVTLPPDEVTTFVCRTALLLERRNLGMNRLIGELVDQMRGAGLTPVLVKGSGVARCYERPLWRRCGDIDLLFSPEEYPKAVAFLLPLATRKRRETNPSVCTHLYFGEWAVDMIGALWRGPATKVNAEMDALQREAFAKKNFRFWRDGEHEIPLLGVDDDLFLLFSHFVKHFYRKGVVLRQVCDWCRFLWTYREEVDVDLLAARLRRTDLMREWKAFAALAVDVLGMPVAAMPFYQDKKKWHAKGAQILDFILKGGFQRRQRDYLALARMFPAKFMTLWVLPSVRRRVRKVFRG